MKSTGTSCSKTVAQWAVARNKGSIVACFCLLVACVGSSNAQTSDLYGTVTDSLTRQRIPFTNISVVGTTWGSAANNLGFYFISKLPPGTYEISASSIGYVKASRALVVKEGQAVELNFALASVPVLSEEVIVTAPRKQLELETKTTSVHVLERQDLRQVPVAGQQDLLQSLKLLPGIVSTSDVSARFYVRGGAGDQNLFMFDGIRIYYPFHALGIYSVFSPEVVDNVEVYTGAFPPGYGGRLSSVVNITARDGRADKLASRANINLLSSELGIEGPLSSQTSVIVNGRKSISSRTFSNIVGQDIPVSFYDLTGKVSIQASGVSKFGFSFLSSGDNMAARSNLQSDYTWKNNGFAISGSGLPTDKMFVNCVVYVSSYAAERSASIDGNITAASTSVKEGGMRVNATLYTGPQDLYYFGFDFNFPTLRYSFINRLGVLQELAGTPLEVSSWVRYSTVMGPFALDGGFHLQLGYLLSGSDPLREIQPRVNASYLLAGTWRAKASFGRFSQRMMTIDNEDDVLSIFDAWVSLSQDSKPEQADHYVVGISGNLTEQTTLNFETYYKRYNSLSVYNRDKIDVFDPDYIMGSGNACGAELTLRSHFQIVDLYGVYSLGWVRINNGGFFYYPRYDRRHHINFLAVSHPAKGLTTTLKWEYGSGFPFSQTVAYFDRMTFGNLFPAQFETETGSPFIMLGPKNAVRLPAYHRMDIGVGYNFRVIGLDVNAGVDLLNVYNNKNIFYFDRRTGQRVNMLSFYPSATLTVQY
ncbi:MAG: TonB-dependent receptor [Ignavibacteriales bacterium]|nr:TonB-dependent receptor [Ignavibacteriales bacterium]